MPHPHSHVLDPDNLGPLTSLVPRALGRWFNVTLLGFLGKESRLWSLVAWIILGSTIPAV